MKPSLLSELLFENVSAFFKKTFRYGSFFCIAFAWFFMSSPHAYASEPKKILIIQALNLDLLSSAREFYIQAMEQAGLKQDQHVEYLVFNAEGSQEKAEIFLKDHMEVERVDHIVCIGTVAAKAVIRTVHDRDIPMVFLYVSRPDEIGMTKEEESVHHLRITGVQYAIPTTTKLSLVAQILRSRPLNRSIRIGLFYSDYMPSAADMHLLVEASKAHSDIEFIPVRVEHDGDYLKMKGWIGQNEKNANPSLFDYIWIAAGPLSADPAFLDYVNRAYKDKLIYAENGIGVEKGAMLGFITDPEANGRLAAQMSAKILNGEDPKTIPIQFAEEIKLAFNISSIKKMNLTIPSSILELGKENIYE